MIDFKKMNMQLVGEDGKVIRNMSFSRKKVDKMVDINYWEELIDLFLEDE